MNAVPPLTKIKSTLIMLLAFSFNKSIGLATIWILIFIPTTQAALNGVSWDPPGPPAIQVQVELDQIWGDARVLGYPDGLNGNYEPHLTIDLKHNNHRSTTYEFSDTNSLFWFLPKIVFYKEFECTPRDTVTVTVSLQEDSTLAEPVSLVSTSGEVATVMTVLANNTPGVREASAGWALGVAAGNTIIKANNYINSVVPLGDFGEDTSTLKEGKNTLEFKRDNKIAAKVVLELTTVKSPANNSNCIVDPPLELETPEEKTAVIYDNLEAILSQIPDIDPEPGNPLGISQDNIEDIHKTYLEITIGLAEWAAAAVTQFAADYQGINEAIVHLQNAKTQRAGGDTVEALEEYRNAFLSALTVIESGNRTSQSLPPFHATIVPNFLTPNPKSTIEIPLMVTGFDVEQGFEGQINISGNPEEINTDVEVLGPGVYKIAFEIGDISPGIYPIDISLTGGPFIVNEQVTLSIHSRNNPTIIRPEIVNNKASLLAVSTSLATDAASNEYIAIFNISTTFRNDSSDEIQNPYFEVLQLSGENRLLNASAGDGGSGSILVPDVGDKTLSPGETTTVEFKIGLNSLDQFSFYVNLLGATNQ